MTNTVSVQIMGKFDIDKPRCSTLTKWIDRANRAIRFNEMSGNQQEAINLKKHRDYLGGLLVNE